MRCSISVLRYTARKRTNLVGLTRASHSLQSLDRIGFEARSRHFEHSYIKYVALSTCLLVYVLVTLIER